MKHCLLILSVVLIFNFESLAQDVQLSQFHVADLLLNPALAGSKVRNRFMLHQRFQWPSLEGSYNTSFVSFDTYLHKYKSGVGTYLIYDNQGDGIMKSYTWNILYSYELHINKNWAARLGIQGGVFQKQLNDQDLIYPNQVTPDGITSKTVSNTSKYSQADFTAGTVIYNKNFWLSLSYLHINQPRQNFLNGENLYPSKFSSMIGYKIPIGHIKPTQYDGYKKEFYLFPVVHYKFQGKSDQLELGLEMIDDQLRIGIWYRGIPFKKYDVDLHNNESIILLAGWRYKNLEVVYSYDIVVSELQPARTGGAHELNLSFIFPMETKHNNYKKLPCPDFQKAHKLPMNHHR